MTYQPKPANELIEYLDSYGPPLQEDDRRFNRAVKDIGLSEATPELASAVLRYLHQHSGPKFKDGNIVGRANLVAWLERNLLFVEAEFLRLLQGKVWLFHIGLLRAAYRAGVRELAGRRLCELVDELAIRDGHSLSVREDVVRLAKQIEQAG